jgi:regulatory protein
LSRRDYSREGLRRRLLDKGFDPADVDRALQRCEQLDYLDDARFAGNRARQLMAQGRAVGPRILADLRQHGIAEEVAARALDQARAAHDETELLGALLERRFPGFDYDTAADREKRRVIHFLQRRGFPIDRIMAQLTRKGIAE